MKVDVLRSTDRPERLVCQAARGDYFDGYVGDTMYAELMRDVDYNESDASFDYGDSNRGLEKWESKPVLDAKTKAFIEKQLSRGHYGPWEHPQITFAVKGVSRVTMAQITRHRHLTFDVQSQRYVDFSKKDDPVVTPESIVADEHVSRETGLVELADVDPDFVEESYQKHVERAFDWYERMVDHGVPKEDARFVLPLGTKVNMTLSGNARTFLHLLDMRRKADSQWEIRELSELLLDELFEWMPYTFDWYQENGPNKLSP